MLECVRGDIDDCSDIYVFHCVPFITYAILNVLVAGRSAAAQCLHAVSRNWYYKIFCWNSGGSVKHNRKRLSRSSHCGALIYSLFIVFVPRAPILFRSYLSMYLNVLMNRSVCEGPYFHPSERQRHVHFDNFHQDKAVSLLSSF